jgi:hypothetical protein
VENKLESHALLVKSRESALLEQAKEIKELRDKLSELDKVTFKLNMKGMYAFCVCM